MDWLPHADVMCHHTGFEKSCKDMVLNCKCRKWVFVDGVNPNTGETVKKYDCVDAWLPALLIENAAQSRAAGAAVESFRNEMAVRNEQAARATENILRRVVPAIAGSQPIKAIDAV